jgi:hypothetical protein
MPGFGDHRMAESQGSFTAQSLVSASGVRLEVPDKAMSRFVAGGRHVV